MLFGRCTHIRSVPLQKVNHVDVSMQTCEMQSCDSFIVGYIDPCFELIFERRVVSMVLEIFSGKGFEVEDVNLHFGKLVLE